MAEGGVLRGPVDSRSCRVRRRGGHRLALAKHRWGDDESAIGAVERPRRSWRSERYRWTQTPSTDAFQAAVRPGAPAGGKRSFLQKVVEFIHPGPDSLEELIATLAEAENNQVIGADARVMLERVIRM